MKKKVQDVEFTPKDGPMGDPKEGKHDDKEHSGGNTWAGGVCLVFIVHLQILIPLHHRLEDGVPRGLEARAGTSACTKVAISSRCVLPHRFGRLSSNIPADAAVYEGQGSRRGQRESPGDGTARAAEAA